MFHYVYSGTSHIFVQAGFSPDGTFTIKEEEEEEEERKKEKEEKRNKEEE